MLGILAQLEFAARALVAAKPAPSPTTASIAEHVSYLEAVNAVRDASAALVPGPPNPLITYPDSTYKYRAVSAEAWTFCNRPNHDPAYLDTMIRAWVCASESADVVKYPQYAIAISECVANTCKRLETTPARLCLGGKKAPGHFGQQSGRWCATTQWPRMKHLTAAQYTAVFGDKCELWVDGRVMDRGFQAGKELDHNAFSIVERRAAQGYEVVPSPTFAGVKSLDDYVLMRFAWKGKGKARASVGLEIVRDGRKRWKITPHKETTVDLARVPMSVHDEPHPKD